MKLHRLTTCYMVIFLAGCAGAPIAAIHLPEPQRPACLLEEPLNDGQIVGNYKFTPAFISYLRDLLAADSGSEATMGALGCAAEAAKALREGVAVIRTNNEASK